MNTLDSSEVVVLVPTYNSSKSISQTIESIRSQSYDCDLVVIDNNSSDDTVKIAASLGAVVIKNKTNVGRIGNWNECIKYAVEKNYAFFKIVFAGDLIYKRSVEKAVNALKLHSYCDVYASNHDVDGKPRFISEELESGFYSGETARKFYLKYGNWTSSTSFHLFRVEGVRGRYFDEVYAWSSDWRYFAEAAIDNGVFYERLSLGSFSSAHRNYYNIQMKSIKSLIEELAFLFKISKVYNFVSLRCILMRIRGLL